MFPALHAASNLDVLSRPAIQFHTLAKLVAVYPVWLLNAELTTQGGLEVVFEYNNYDIYGRNNNNK